MLSVYRDWSQGDPSFLDLISSSDDMLLIGTDPAEWYRGGASVRAVFGQQLTELGEVEIVPGDMLALTTGELGWVVDNPRFRFADGNEVALRSTVIFGREPSGWSIIHWHVSVGAANEESIGIELTTSLEAVLASVEAEQPDLGPIAADDGTVTIAFTDIESSTALNERLGDRAWFEILRRHDELVRAQVASHDGRVVKNQGDGYMLAFSTPDRGVRCAMSIQEALASEPAEPVGVRVRMGLHAGEPIRQADDFFGRDVAYAARVAAAASGGEILVSARVRELVDTPEVGFTPPRTVSFKGFDGEHVVYAVAEP